MVAVPNNPSVTLASRINNSIGLTKSGDEDGFDTDWLKAMRLVHTFDYTHQMAEMAAVW